MDVTNYITSSLQQDFGVNVSFTDINKTLQLFDQDLTIPFIARYRRQQTGDLDAEKLRLVQQTNEYFKKLQNKIGRVVNKIENDVSREYLSEIKSAKTIEEVDELYAPFKKGEKTLAERARKLGLEDIAKEFMSPLCERRIYLNQYINENIKGLESVVVIESGIQHIIADQIAKDIEILEKLRDEIEQNSVYLTTKKSVKCAELDHNKKYQLYYEFNKCTKYLKNHQILAINRAEKEKIIRVGLQIDEKLRRNIICWIKEKWIPRRIYRENEILLEKSVEDSYKRLIEKNFFRKIRRKLTKKAEHDAVNVFSSNLKHLLMVAPVKHKIVMSIDPGFSNGCKVAVIDEHGNLLETSVIFPFRGKMISKAEQTLIDLARKYQIDLVAIGNGTACRETEKVVSDLIQSKKLSVSYCIVDEAGASVYSVTPEAKKEFGDLDPNFISSVSIGRRLQDPLLELTKIDPKHLGVGMYQHDVDSKLLQGILHHTIDDCVNFVGVDINACSSHLLKHIAGLSQKQADSIIEYRTTYGDFINREELLQIKGIGKVTYHNCAGFVRVIAKTKTQEDVKFKKEAGTSKRKLIAGKTSCNKKQKKKAKNFQPELLDQTCIHPESYPVTIKVLEHVGATKEMLGTFQMKKIFEDKTSLVNDLEKLAVNVSTDVHTLQLILDGLKQPCDYDIREGFVKPAFKAEITTMDQLKEGLKVTGSVRNVTSFGTFVDIGVKCNGLIHNNNNMLNVELGPADRVECQILNIDPVRNRIGLRLLRKITNDLRLL